MASDMWSFGIVMYEIWSRGHKPYEGMTNKIVKLCHHQLLYSWSMTCFAVPIFRCCSYWNQATGKLLLQAVLVLFIAS